MGKATADVAHRPVQVKVNISKNPRNKNIWLIEPQLKAFPNPHVINKKT